jgi:hypothetical protein
MMLMDHRQTPDPEKPRAEPEIIPPDHTHRRSPGGDTRIWVSRGGYYRVFIATPGPLTVILAFLMLGGVALGLLAALLGAFIIALPVIGVLVVSLALASLLRGHVGRLR